MSEETKPIDMDLKGAQFLIEKINAVPHAIGKPSNDIKDVLKAKPIFDEIAAYAVTTTEFASAKHLVDELNDNLSKFPLDIRFQLTWHAFSEGMATFGDSHKVLLAIIIYTPPLVDVLNAYLAENPEKEA